MAEFVFMAHSGWRYLVLATGLLVLILALAGMSTKGNPARAAHRMFRVFVIVLDIQVLLGIVVVFLRPFLPMYIGHIVLMLAAMLVGHGVATRVRRLPPERPGTGLILSGTALALVLVMAGILAIQRPII